MGNKIDWHLHIDSIVKRLHKRMYSTTNFKVRAPLPQGRSSHNLELSKPLTTFLNLSTFHYFGQPSDNTAAATLG